jgi:membrane fusion protein (multidrug efflux system)
MNTNNQTVSEGTEKTKSIDGIKSKRMRDRMKITISNVIVFLVVVGGFFWLVRNYFHIGNNDFTNAAQVEGFVNPINVRISGWQNALQIWFLVQ